MVVKGRVRKGALRVSGAARLLGTTALTAMVLAGPVFAQGQGTGNGQSGAIQSGLASPGAGAVMLSPVTVEGQGARETGVGPVQGYVATRSTTGAKTDTPIDEIPQSISVISADRIRAQQAQSLPEALRYTTGVLAQPWGVDQRYDQFSLRGFEVTSTGLYLDGMRLENVGMSGWQYDPYGLERIEVLRGPASVLYGQSPPGGLVNMVVKRPPSEPLHEVEAQYGSFDRKQLSFDLGGPVDEAGVWSYRLTALGRDSDMEIKHARDDRIFVAPALTWRPTSDTTLTLHASYQRDWNSSYGTLPALGTRYANPNGKISREFFIGDPNFDKLEQTQYTLGYFFEHRFDETWTVRQNLRYGHVDTEQRVLYGAGQRADQRTMDRAAFTVDNQLDSITVDNQVQAKLSTGPLNHTLLVGLDYRRVSHDAMQGYSDSTYANVPTIDLFNPVYGLSVETPPIYNDSRQTTSQLGLYAQDQIKLDGWILTLGVRQDWTHSENKNQLTGTKTKQDDQAFTYRAGLGYQFDFGLTPYASYTKSFEPVTGTDASGKAFDPSTGEQFEIGAKYQPPGMNSFLTVALYHLTQENRLTWAATNPPSQRQTGEITARGLELEGVASLADGLNLIASYTFNDAEITSDGNPAIVGNRPKVTPRHMASAWLDYSFPDGPLAGFGLGGGVRYVGETYADDINSFKNSSFTLADAAVHYDFSNVRLALNASNLFDRDYVICNGDAASCIYGPGRTVIASVRYRW